MKTICSLILIVLLFHCAPDNPREIKEGDIIFQTSASSQSKAIQLATRSKYSHMGIIFEHKGEWHVFEAIAHVQFTPLEEWIKRGVGSHYVIKRLKKGESIITDDVIRKMKKRALLFKGKKYDTTFGWSDNKIYCSELVWKIYKRVMNIEIGEPEKLADFNLDHKIVKDKLKERYGTALPLQETVISPRAMYNADNLKTIIARNDKNSSLNLRSIQILKRSREANLVISKNILKKRFNNFSTAGSYILVCIQDKESEKKEFIVCENEEWFLLLLKEKEYSIHDEKEYSPFMLAHYNTCFKFSNRKFSELSGEYGAPRKNEYDILKKKGLHNIISTFFTKRYWNAPKNDGQYAYFIKDHRKYSRDRSFIRILLEMGLVVRRECESGYLYIESDEIDHPEKG
ncbi:MAG: YiiX family permuted papain-like enzyme [Spirochaetes bacterium]|nr:YiiX family permuted papain-like enzyme [Spirochaetota bacterium]